MGFFDAIKSGFVNYVNFSGRAVRSEYWYWVLFSFICGIVTVILDAALFPDNDLSPLNAIFTLGTFLPSLAVGARRLHDIDRTGWWLLWQLLIILLAVFLTVVAFAVPKEQGAVWYALAGAAVLVAFIISVWLFVQIGFLRGTQGPNRFGPDPLGPERSDAQL